jgi:hypothetical protein
MKDFRVHEQWGWLSASKFIHTRSVLWISIDAVYCFEFLGFITSWCWIFSACFDLTSTTFHLSLPPSCPLFPLSTTAVPPLLPTPPIFVSPLFSLARSPNEFLDLLCKTVVYLYVILDGRIKAAPRPVRKQTRYKIKTTPLYYPIKHLRDGLCRTETRPSNLSWPKKSYLKSSSSSFRSLVTKPDQTWCHGRQFTPSTRVNAGNHKPY